MAVPTLTLLYKERNDNKLITLTDVTPDWGTPTVGDITTLTLNVEITLSVNTTTIYDIINLVDLVPLTDISTQDNLIFEIDGSVLKVDGNAMGTSDTVLPDGIYKFTYTLDKDLGTESILEEYVLMEGNVRNSVYQVMRVIPTLYMCNECKSKQIMDAIFAYGMLNSIRAGGYVAKTEELINQLYVLERLLEYGSSYTW
jgi:hypothetical protein